MASIQAVAGLILPFEAIEEFYKQTQYLMSDDDRFDAMEMSLAGIELLTIIPVAKPLAVLIKPLKAVLRPLIF